MFAKSKAFTGPGPPSVRDYWSCIADGGPGVYSGAEPYQPKTLSLRPEPLMLVQTEDLAFALELQQRGYKGIHLQEKLAEGEAPPRPQDLFAQLSRSGLCHLRQMYLCGRGCPTPHR